MDDESPSSYLSPISHNHALIIRFWNFNQIPFRVSVCFLLLNFPNIKKKLEKQNIYNTNLLHSHLTIPLGPTYPYTNTVDMEPFSTLVFKVLIWIIATTTKICTKSCFTHTHVYALSHVYKIIIAFTSTYMWGYQSFKKKKYTSSQQSIRNMLKRHPFSGLFHSAGKLWHTP